MKFIDYAPTTWKELQDLVALLLDEAGFRSVTPCTIETVRGKVEVDVFVQSPDIFVKSIICECKFWKTRVSKEKVHAFRTVVHDSGASLGLIISSIGFQAGAMEAAELSNVKLFSWDSFTDTISEKWIIEKLKRIKIQSNYLMEYINPLHFPYEKLTKDTKPRYDLACEKYMPLKMTCWLLSKSDLLNDSCILKDCYDIDSFTSIVSYLNYLESEVLIAIDEFRHIVEDAGIFISEERFQKSDFFTYMNL